MALTRLGMSGVECLSSSPVTRTEGSTADSPGTRASAQLLRPSIVAGIDPLYSRPGFKVIEPSSVLQIVGVGMAPS